MLAIGFWDVQTTRRAGLECAIAWIPEGEPNSAMQVTPGEAGEARSTVAKL